MANGQANGGMLGGDSDFQQSAGWKILEEEGGKLWGDLYGDELGGGSDSDDDALPEEHIVQHALDAGWFNLFVAELWEFVNEAVLKTVNLKVMVALRQQAVVHKDMLKKLGVDPTVLEQAKLDTFRLGPKPLQFGALSLYRKSVQETGEKVIQLDMDVDYEDTVDICVDAIVMKLRITKLSFHGRVSIVLRPLVSEKPIVAGTQIFFLDVPKLGYDFEVAEAGTALSAMVNMLKSTIRKTVVSEFQNAMVMPNRILVQLKVSEALEQTIDWGAVTHPNPEGVLRVRIVSARDLVGSDLAVFTQPTSDPYFTLTIGSQTSKTSVISRTCNPDWPEEEHFDFLCFHEDQQLVLDCFDEDMFSADDLLGRVRGVTIRQMQDRARTLDGFKYAVWLNLDVSEVEGAEDLQGKSRVLLELQFFVLSHEIPGRQQADLEAKALAGELQTTELTQSLLGRFPSQGSDMDDASPTSQAPKPVTSVNATLCNFLGAGGCGMTPTARDFPFGGARAPALPGGCNTAWLSVVLHGARGLPVDMMNKMRVKVIVSGGLRGEAPEEKLSKKAKIKQPRIQWKQQVPLTVQQVIGRMIFEEGLTEQQVAHFTELSPETVKQVIRVHEHFHAQWDQAQHFLLASPLDAQVTFNVIADKKKPVGKVHVMVHELLQAKHLGVKECISVPFGENILTQLQARGKDSGTLELSLSLKLRYLRKVRSCIPV